MTTELKTELEKIKAACREVIEMDIYRSHRTVTPALARITLTAIEAMESWSLVSSEGNPFANVLQILVAQWKEGRDE